MGRGKILVEDKLAEKLGQVNVRPESHGRPLEGYPCVPFWGNDLLLGAILWAFIVNVRQNLPTLTFGWGSKGLALDGRRTFSEFARGSLLGHRVFSSKLGHSVLGHKCPHNGSRKGPVSPERDTPKPSVVMAPNNVS